MTAEDSESYAQQVQADGVPVLGDDEEVAVDALPWDGRPVKKCILLPDRTIAKCVTGHGEDKELMEFIQVHHAANN